MPAATKIQSIERAAALLRLVAAKGERGARITDLARDAKLTKGTAHRLLAALAAEGLIEQDAATNLYFAGLGLVGLGAAATARFNLARSVLPAMHRIAEKSDDTVYFSVRQGNEAVCLQRVEGQFPIKTLTLNIGDRRPLGLGAGSLAMLAFLPDEQVDRVISDVAPELARRAQVTTGEMHAMVQESRRLGYAFNDQRVIAGMCAIGVPIRDQRGEPVAALSVAAVSARMEPERRASIVAWIEREVVALGQEFGDVLGGQAEPRRRAANENRRAAA